MTADEKFVNPLSLRATIILTHSSSTPATYANVISQGVKTRLRKLADSYHAQVPLTNIAPNEEMPN